MFIQEVDIFKGISPQVIDEIAKLITEESYPAGHVLFQEGDFANYLYILEEGELELTIKREKRLAFPVDKKGEVFGWSSLVEPNLYTARAECVKKSRVTKIDAVRLMPVLQKHPADGLTIMTRLTGVIATRLITTYKLVI